MRLRVGKYKCRFCQKRHSNGWYCKTYIKHLRDKIERLRLVFGAIATYDQDERPLQNEPSSLPFDWKRRSMKQEELARGTINREWSNVDDSAIILEIGEEGKVQPAAASSRAS